MASKPWTAEALRRWLAEKVATELRLDPSEIDDRTPFTHYGLDSVTAVTIASDLEECFGRSFEPTLLWDYPTITELVDFVFATRAPELPAFSDAEQEAIRRLLEAAGTLGGPAATSQVAKEA